MSFMEILQDYIRCVFLVHMLCDSFQELMSRGFILETWY